jgi:hypothetical protein
VRSIDISCAQQTAKTIRNRRIAAHTAHETAQLGASPVRQRAAPAAEADHEGGKKNTVREDMLKYQRCLRFTADGVASSREGIEAALERLRAKGMVKIVGYRDGEPVWEAVETKH